MPRFQLIVEEFSFFLPAESDLANLEMAGEDEPIPLKLAMFLPTISPDWSEKVLRGAIDRGDLQAERIGRKIYVTKRAIAAWRESCRVRRNPPISGSCPRNSTSTAPFVNTPSGTSRTQDAALARAAALRTFEELSKPSKTTSSTGGRRQSRS